MNILKVYRFRLKTIEHREDLLIQYVGCGRFVYNRALSIQMDRHKQGLKKLSYPELAKELVIWKKSDEIIFLKLEPAQILQQKLMDLDRVYINFLQKRADFPKFCKQEIHDSCRFPEHIQIQLYEGNSKMQFPKLRWIRYEKNQKVTGQLRNVTISYETGHFYMSIQTENTMEDPVHESKSTVGVDLGIAHFVTLSTGEHVPAMNHFKRQKVKLDRQQRSFSHKWKGGQNQCKQRLKISKIHQKIWNCQWDHLHKITTHPSKNHAIIVLGDMSR